jgi:2,4-dienoyl-CoA reductase-like NADH-dependent reductase (Old Yellow Enzyme family)
MARGEFFTHKTLADLRERVKRLDVADDLGFADDVMPSGKRWLSTPGEFGKFAVPNRFVAHPMEGWDGDPATGEPTEDVYRRWERIGASGCAIAWGVEAFAVDTEYRANRNQVVFVDRNAKAIAFGIKRMRAAHAKACGTASPLVIGAQLTCSGRYSYGRPDGSPLLLMYHHPELDQRLKAGPETPLMTDTKCEDLVGQYARAAKLAVEVGFDFIDIKACHRYWLNEALAAKTRPGPYGGSFENRVKLFLMIVDAIRREVGPAFLLGSRLSAYDGVPFEEDPSTKRPGLKGYGRPVLFDIPYRWGWGVNEANPLESDLAEPALLIGLLKAKGLTVFNITAGSPYSNPHLSRPTDSPPVDGYQPAWDPLKEVAQHMRLTRAVKGAHPDVTVVGTGYSYLQQFKAHAAEFNLAAGRVDFAGLGRATLAYPDEAKQVLDTGTAKPSRGKVVCTGDSACTTGPRMGLKSGCIYDPYYVDINQEINRKLAALGLTKK